MPEKKIGPLERDANHYVTTHTPQECAEAARKMVAITEDARRAGAVLREAGNVIKAEG